MANKNILRQDFSPHIMYNEVTAKTQIAQLCTTGMVRVQNIY